LLIFLIGGAYAPYASCLARPLMACGCIPTRTFVLEQILRQMETALQYQITYEYNKTALPSNVTDAETNRITAAWDIMQIEVSVFRCIFIVQRSDHRRLGTRYSDQRPLDKRLYLDSARFR